MPSSFLNFTPLIGIDLGSSWVRIWSDKSGIVVEEPTCIAVDQRSQKVVAVGVEALEMSGRVKGHIKVYFPIQKGKVHDFKVARALLQVILQKVLKKSLFSPVIMVSIPASLTPMAEKIVIELFHSLGAKEVYVIGQPLAAAIGSGVPVADASGGLILNMGAGVVEGAVISLGSIVNVKVTTRAGRVADEQIILELRKAHRLEVGRQVAEKIKLEVGRVGEGGNKKVVVAGKRIDDSFPEEKRISSSMVAAPLTKLADHYHRLLKKLLSSVPAELTVDILDKGLLLSGGWSQLAGWENFFVQGLGIPVSVVDKPQQAVIEGVGTVLEHLDLFKSSLGYQR